MWEYIEERVLQEARYIVQHGATVRETANYFGISKSTVHNDMTMRLEEMDEELYFEVRKVSDKNLAERHIRGGIATQKKYSQKHGQSHA
jgi:putative DeoR family transcriptional regulator (stage III sporulation protein D)